jgi:hypothetical protein
MQGGRSGKNECIHFHGNAALASKRSGFLCGLRASSEASVRQSFFVCFVVEFFPEQLFQKAQETGETRPELDFSQNLVFSLSGIVGLKGFVNPFCRVDRILCHGLAVELMRRAGWKAVGVT